MSYIDVKRELYECKNHTGAIMIVISRMQEDIKAIFEATKAITESLNRENRVLAENLELIAQVLQDTKKAKRHEMKTRSKSRKITKRQRNKL